MGATMAPQPSPPASRPRGRDLRAPQKTATAPPEPMESPRALPLLELLSWGKHQCEPTIAFCLGDLSVGTEGRSFDALCLAGAREGEGERQEHFFPLGYLGCSNSGEHRAWP